ncbi:hypothetical protein OAA91_00080 [Fibrobacterales bacterium]|nr:hypothetical protein [Fibrobacterales bacterium]
MNKNQKISKVLTLMVLLVISSCFFDSDDKGDDGVLSSIIQMSSDEAVSEVSSSGVLELSSSLIMSSSSEEPSYKVIAFQPFYAKIASAEQLDKLTHLIYFSILPRYDGGVDDNEVIQEDLKYLTEEMHKRNKKILISVGGVGAL